MDNPREEKLNVLMLPFLAYGHVFPYLELAKRLVSCQQYKIDIHICSTPVILQAIKDNLASSSSSELANQIKLIELKLPELPELPSHLHSTKDLHPHLVPRLMRAFDLSAPAFADLLVTLRPDILIYDMHSVWAPVAARQLGIPAIHFNILGATSVAFLHHHFIAHEKPFPFPSIDVGIAFLNRPEEIPEEPEQELTPWEQWGPTMESSSDFIVIRSLPEIESKYIDYISLLTGKEVVPVPLLAKHVNDNLGNEKEYKRIMGWLGNRERRSVVLVSFGSSYVMRNKEMEQLSIALEMSEANFIWIVRLLKHTEENVKAHDPDAFATELPAWFMANLQKEKGIVVNSWAPQMEILAHPNLGAFLTHCGRSSILEGMKAGVPMIALPLEIDQPLNAKLIVELGIGLEIPQQCLGNFKAEDAATCIKKVLKSEHGEKMREKAEDMSKWTYSRNEDADIELLARKLAVLCNSRAVGANSSVLQLK
ncbi:Glycosyltransferase [Rhynchospora pubera]|uniref:Glycosyltransferase n=1 Tax=Rhynchospora pubera TaxID=906938 RepID=A0AAV8G1V4_9POAL|nr:Glycosyltransferase [Rhynchospora pubera]